MKDAHPFMRELRRERCAREMSQEAAAEATNIARTTLMRYELGAAHPRIDDVQRYASLLGYELRLVRKETA